MNTLERMRQEAAFIYKPIKLEELKLPVGSRLPFVVERIAEVTTEQFNHMGEELYGYYRFLYDNRDVMWYDADQRQMHCILITTVDRKDGILLEAEGYAYAQYAAYVPELTHMDLEKIPKIEQPDLSADLPVEYWIEHPMFPQQEENTSTKESR